MKRIVPVAIMCALLNLGFASEEGVKKSDLNDFSKTRFKNIDLFNKVLYLIEKNYYREIDQKKLINGAIKGMISSLDPHSSFLDEEVFQKMQEETSGEFGGLGIEVTQKDGVLVVITPIEDTPAFKAGVLAGDRIVEIDGVSTSGLLLEEAVERMRGELGSTIKLGISRENEKEILYFSLKRETIKLKPVKSEIFENRFLYLRLTNFQKDSGKYLSKAIKKAQKKLKSKKLKLKGIVFDLRSNPGGLLEEAVNVSSLFLQEGVVVSTEGRDDSVKDIKSVKKMGFKVPDIPLVVLINGASASASEIVAGAIQDQKRGIIMGERSFGKGSVQTIAKVDEKQGVKLTIAQYMTPSGKKIQALGIKPDIELKNLGPNWLKANRQNRYIREKDLRNHLTATIETEDEKKLREKNKRSRKKTKKMFQDFQVLQAMKYLEGVTIYSNILKK